MTRKVRCGNTQKHQKMPEDATPWEELSRDIKATAQSSTKLIHKKVKIEKNDESFVTANEVEEQECLGTEEVQSKRSSKKLKEVKTDDSFEKSSEDLAKNKAEDKEWPVEGERKRKRSSMKFKKEKTEDSSEKPSEDLANNEAEGNEWPVEEERKKKRSSKKKFKKTKEEDLSEDNLATATEGTSTEDTNIPDGKKLNKFMKKDKINKKKIFQQKLLQRRIENGVTLLAPNQERKLYLLKKKLREKGYPPEAIKEIARKKRREEEIKFRKTFTNKICFHCRDRGHLLSNCPQRLGTTKQVTGVCFKCGSTEHVSYRCQKKIDGYPLAKCFICKEQGHISKECPKNNRGVYIKGGACRECGNVNHLQKDCPLLVKKKVDPSIPLYTIQDGTSMDAEIVEDGPINKKKTKRPKVVKF